MKVCVPKKYSRYLISRFREKFANFTVVQYITKFFCAKKSNFSITFSDILKYNHSERKKIDSENFSRNLISRLLPKTAKISSIKVVKL